MTDKILIEYQVEVDKLKAELKQVQTTLKSVETSGKKAANETSKSFEKAGSSIKESLLQIGGALGIAFGAQQMIQFGKEAIQLAAKAEGIKKAFDKLNSPKLLDNLREATKGTVSDLELMKAAVKANNFQLPLEQLATLLKFAQQRAQETGESVEYLTESIVLGISRKSIPILDNLGISSQQVQNEFKKTGDFAVAVGNIVNKSLEEQGTLALTTADKMAKISAAWENMKVKVGEFAIDFVDNAMDVYEVNKLLFTQGYDAAQNLQKENQVRYDQIELLKEYQTELDKVNLKDKSAVEAQIKRNNIALKQAAESLKNTIELKRAGELDASDEKLLITLEARFKAQKQINQKFLNDVALANKKASTESIALTEEELKKIKDAEIELRDLRASIIEDEKERELAQLVNKYTDLSAGLEQGSEKLLLLQKKYEQERNAIIKKYDDAEKADNESQWQQAIKDAEAASDAQARIDKIAYDKAKELRKKEVEDEKKKQEQIRQLRNETSAFSIQLLDSYSQISSNRTTMQLQESEEAAKVQSENLKQQYEAGYITRVEYEQKTKALDDKARKEQADIRRKQFEQEKAISLIKIAISTAQGIANALEGDPYTVAYRVAFAALTGAAQAAVVASQPTPKFAKGVVDLKGKGTKTSDEIPALLSRGESVITSDATATDRELFKAFNKGKGQKYIYEVYVAPALKEQLKKHSLSKDSSFAQNIANSMMLNSGKLNDGNILESLKMNRRLEKENTEKLIRAIKLNNTNIRSIV